MIKAYKFGLSVSDNDYIVEKDNNQQGNDDSFDFNGNDDFNLSSEWISIDWCRISTDSNDNDDDASIWLSCFAPSRHLAIRDGLKDTPYLSKSLSKCIKLARRSHKSAK